METETPATADAVAEIFVAAGWTPGERDGWNGQFTWANGLIVGGVDPWGVARTTARAANGGTVEEAAAWLVEHAKERAPAIFTTPMTLDLPPLAVSGDETEPVSYADHEDDAEQEIELGLDAVRDDGEADLLIDADFTEDTDLPGLPQDLGAEILDADASESATPQDRFYGLDDLDRRRSLRIGDVVRISRAKQAEIAALMGEHDFASLQGQVLRDTIDGAYRGPQGVYDLFVELSLHQNAMTRVRIAEADKVAFIEAANRDELEAFDPEAGWP